MAKKAQKEETLQDAFDEIKPLAGKTEAEDVAKPSVVGTPEGYDPDLPDNKQRWLRE